MAAAAILDFVSILPVLEFPIRRSAKNMPVKFDQNRSIFGRVIAIVVNSIWRPPPSWFFVYTSGVEDSDVPFGGECSLKIS